ncbi:MAG: hypothetical protein ACK5P3_14280, partial [Dolichospermum sp.]
MHVQIRYSWMILGKQLRGNTISRREKQVLADKSDGKAVGVAVANSSSPERKPAFTLYIWQPGGTISEVTARISIKSKYGDKYRQERFLGDYRYRMKQKANFVKGFKS